MVVASKPARSWALAHRFDGCLMRTPMTNKRFRAQNVVCVDDAMLRRRQQRQRGKSGTLLSLGERRGDKKNAIGLRRDAVVVASAAASEDNEEEPQEENPNKGRNTKWLRRAFKTYRNISQDGVQIPTAEDLTSGVEKSLNKRNMSLPDLPDAEEVKELGRVFPILWIGRGCKCC